jgi:hypothetical protein
MRGATDVALGDVRASVEAAIERQQAALPDRPLCDFESISFGQATLTSNSMSYSSLSRIRIWCSS